MPLLAAKKAGPPAPAASKAKSAPAKAKEKGGAPKKEKKERKEKKDNGPAKPKGAKALWTAEIKADFKAENSECSGKELTERMNSKWGTLSDSERQKYETKAKAAKLEYDKAFKKWQDSNPQRVAEIEEEKKERKKQKGENKPKAKGKKKKRDESEAESEDTESDDEDGVKRPKKKKAKKDPNQPKKPATSYFRFTAAKRESVKKEFPSLPLTEITKKLGEMWRALSEEDKLPYVNAYQQEMVAFKKLKEDGRGDELDDPAASEEENDKAVAKQPNGTAATNGSAKENGGANGMAKSNGHSKPKRSAKPKPAAAEEADSAKEADADTADADTADADAGAGDASGNGEAEGEANGGEANGEVADAA